jgi:hypothetical protein
MVGKLFLMLKIRTNLMKAQKRIFHTLIELIRTLIM